MTPPALDGSCAESHAAPAANRRSSPGRELHPVLAPVRYLYMHAHLFVCRLSIFSLSQLSCLHLQLRGPHFFANPATRVWFGPCAVHICNDALRSPLVVQQHHHSLGHCGNMCSAHPQPHRPVPAEILPGHNRSRCVTLYGTTVITVTSIGLQYVLLEGQLWGHGCLAGHL